MTRRYTQITIKLRITHGHPPPAETQTLYSELLERLLAEAAHRSIGAAPGVFTRKKVKGEDYLYFQFSQPGGKTRQLYLGRRSPALERLAGRFETARKEAAPERAAIERLSAQTALGGAWTMGGRPARVLKAFALAGVFDAGAVLVGTHAFGLIANALGRVFPAAHLRTAELDLAAVSLAAGADGFSADAEDALERLETGFLPVPALDPRGPSTSFKVRGDALRVDFLTPGKGERPVALPRLGTSAQPLPFLDYLIEDPMRAAVLDAGGFLVLVPAPARFALHKLIVAGERPAFQQAKAAKDFEQALQLLEALSEDRPGDLRLAAQAAREKGWTKRLKDAAARVDKARPGLGRLLR